MISMAQKIVESFNVEEAFLYDKTYLFIKGYASAMGCKIGG